MIYEVSFTLLDLESALCSIPGIAHPVFFYSGGDISETSRYIYLAAYPVQRIVYSSGCLSIDRKVLKTNDPFKTLQNHIRANKKNNREKFFTGGWCGFLSYDLCRELDDIPLPRKHFTSIPDIDLSYYSDVIIYDRVLNKMFLSCTKNISSSRLYGHLKHRIPAKKRYSVGLLHSEMGVADYSRMIKQAKKYISEGEIYQVNLSQRWCASFTGSPAQCFIDMAHKNPVPYAAYMASREFSILSLSPECFIRTDDRDIYSYPIKGTRPRGRNQKHDRLLKQELLNSNKDRAEHIMIVDLERNDLGRICTPGSIRVERMIYPESYTSVHHLISTIRGRLKKSLNPLFILSKIFPGGSITGAPKIRSMQIISELEPVRRQIYTGCMGYIDDGGDMQWNIAIRTLVQTGGVLYLQTGGGIVADSNTREEYDECLHKAAGIFDALDHRNTRSASL